MRPISTSHCPPRRLWTYSFLLKSSPYFTFIYLCVYMGMPVCGHQKTALGSQLSSTMNSRDKIKVVRLGGKYWLPWALS